MTLECARCNQKLPPECVLDSFDMANATELTTQLATLAERVTNHIKFFWVVVGFGFLWLTAVTVYLARINDATTRIAKDQQENNSILRAQRTITELASLPPTEFKASLPDLASTMTTATKQRRRVPSETIDALQTKLLTTDSNAPSFWPAAAEFISYRSFNDASWTPVANLRKCTDSPPSPPTIKEVQSPTKMTLNPGVYENCQFTLDSPEDNQRLNEFLLHTLQIRFKHCLIIYRGGQINLILAFNKLKAAYQVDAPPPASGMLEVTNDHTLEFQECLFDFSFRNTPPEQGQEMTKFLLASNGPIITFDVPKPS